MDSTESIEELTKKMMELDGKLNEEVFKRPIKEVQEKMRQELIEFKRILMKNISDLSSEIGKKISLSNVNEKENANVTEEEVNDLKTALDHKTYQVEILKREFNNYEKKTEDQIDKLKTANEKLKYRIQILLKTIDEIEKGKSN